jgi:ppGpp synthetase/RelA/SpoT-type nucleotidyltranferase
VAVRSIEDQLREQYFILLPEMVRAAEHLKTQIQYNILPIARRLKPHENLIVKARIKECDSAINKLRQRNPIDPLAIRNPGGVFDRDRPELYTLLSLRDLVGVRVLAFPSELVKEVDKLLRTQFQGWIPDPIKDKNGQQLAFKYNGEYADSTDGIQCEYQIVSSLIGLFWDVEHAAIYKRSPNLKGLGLVLQEQTSAVHQALKAFEDEFERQLLISESGPSI